MFLLYCSDIQQRSVNISALYVHMLEPINILSAIDWAWLQILQLGFVYL